MNQTITTPFTTPQPPLGGQALPGGSISPPSSPPGKHPGGKNPPERRDTSPDLDLWRNVYRFYYTFRGMENTEANWKRCIASANGIINLYGRDPLAEMLVFAVYDWIENRIKHEMAA